MRRHPKTFAEASLVTTSCGGIAGGGSDGEGGSGGDGELGGRGGSCGHGGSAGGDGAMGGDAGDCAPKQISQPRKGLPNVRVPVARMLERHKTGECGATPSGPLVPQYLTPFTSRKA